MDGQAIANSAAVSERTTDMADLRKCIGSAKFGIAAHEAPVGDFPTQPSQKDGLDRRCKVHWNQYTTALRKAALARKAADGRVATEVEPARVGKARAAKPAKKPQPIRTKPARGSKTTGDQIVEAVEAGLARDTANAEEAIIA
jgi:hypothetical protein